MVLKSIVIRNFKIHTYTNINFCDKINYLIGGNGQGKTSILEAVYYLCTSRNFNSKNDSEYVNHNNEFFEVQGVFDNLTENKVSLQYSLKDTKKVLIVDGKHIYRASDLIGKYPVVVLTPGDHFITQGSPSERRRFVDSIISQANQTYLQYLLDYNRTLKQRAMLLNIIKETKDRSLIPQLNAWSDKLIITGAGIIRHRIDFINEFVKYVVKSYELIMEDRETPDILYDYLNDENTDIEIDVKFRKLLDQKIDEEIKRGINLTGPHRDDFIFNINGQNLKKYGSQGQHKTFQIMLRFAEYFYLKDTMGRNPVFLMDDVFGELDAHRASRISEHLAELGQTFITLTDFSNFIYLKKTDQDKVFNIYNGKVEYA
jgi:DNA replication and repair protein RecF